MKACGIKMDENYLDMHICLGCRQTIMGLDAYIQHKRFDCSAIRTKEVHKRSSGTSLLQKDSSDAHFACEFTSAVTSSLPSSDFSNTVRSSYASLSSWFEVVTSSANTSQAPVTEILPHSAVPAMNGATHSSVDLADNIVLYTTENCSFFNSLQLKSKATGSQVEDKFKSIDNLTLPECSTNKNIDSVSPFFQQSKQIEQLCCLPSSELKIEADMLVTAVGSDVLTSNSHCNETCHTTELYGQSKLMDESLALCWKNNDCASNNLFNQHKTSSDPIILPERKEDNDETSYPYDHSKALHIACMFSNLELESDSDNFMPSDTDELLNFSDIDDEQNSFTHSHNDEKVNREKGTAGGKLESYKHTEKIEAYARSQGKLLRIRKENGLSDMKQQKSQTRGGKQIATKWRPGERPAVLPSYRQHSSRGKWQGPEGEDVEEDQDDLEEESDDDINEDSGEEEKKNKRIKKTTLLNIFKCEPEIEDRLNQQEVNKDEAADKPCRKMRERPACKTCCKTFATHASMEHHLKTNLHRKRSQNLASLENNQDQPSHIKLECALCNKIFRSKYSFARHLMTPFHAKRAQYNEKHKVIESTGLEAGVQLLMQRLQPFQCRVCELYTSSDTELIIHLKTTEHCELVGSLNGPFICVRCQYACNSNDDMILHVSSPEHASTVKVSSQPCVLKEKRCKISCPDCDAVIHSAVQLSHHQKICHSGAFTRRKRESNESKPLKCSHCAATFMTRFNLAVHTRRLHTKEKPFQCRTCVKAFADNSTLKLHRQSKRHLDAVTSSFIKRENIQNQLRTQDDSGQSKRVYKCRQCEFITDRYSEIVIHRTMQHIPPDCMVCGLRFGNQLQHNKHMMSRQHRKKEEESKISAGDILTCDKCPRKFYNSRSLKMHEMNHQLAIGRISKNNGSGLDSIEVCCRKLVRESKLPNGKVECPECGKYLTKIGILPHLRAHAGIFPFQCTYCGKKFVDANIMRRHLKVHLGIRSYKCQFCNREFDRRLTLDTHLMREHKDCAGIVASHLCNICGHKFLQLNQLNAHLKFHDKTVRCPHPGCPLSFRYQSEMLIHMQVHTKETRFLCDECGYAGKTKTQLSRHRRVHTGERRYKCSHCAYVAAHIANLKRHERVHTGNKPYQCPHCKYSCNTQENLRKHILKTKRHAGKPVYPCPRCEFGCNSATEFQTHMEVVHSISRNHLPSIVAGLYRREADVRPFQDVSDQCLNSLVT